MQSDSVLGRVFILPVIPVSMLAACGCAGSYTARVLERPGVTYQIAGVLPDGRHVDGHDESGAGVSGDTVVYMRPWHERYALVPVQELAGTGADLGAPPAATGSNPQALLDWASQRISAQTLADARTSIAAIEADHRTGKPGAIFDWDVQYSVLGTPMRDHPEWVAVAVGHTSNPYSRKLDSVERVLLLPATRRAPLGERLPNGVRAVVSMPFAFVFDGFFFVCAKTGDFGNGIGWLLYPGAEDALGIPGEGAFRPDPRHWLAPTWDKAAEVSEASGAG